MKEKLKEIPKGLWGIITRKDEWAEARRSLKILFVVTIVIITVLFFTGVDIEPGILRDTINTLLLASIALAAILFVILWWYAILAILGAIIFQVVVEGGLGVVFKHWKISLAVILLVAAIGLFWWLYKKRKEEPELEVQLEDQLKELKEKLDRGAITQEEYEHEKNKLQKRSL